MGTGSRERLRTQFYPNAAVYEIVKVLGPHKLKIKPEAKADGQSAYSIGRRCYGKFTVSNCDFFLLGVQKENFLLASLSRLAFHLTSPVFLSRA